MFVNQQLPLTPSLWFMNRIHSHFGSSFVGISFCSAKSRSPPFLEMAKAMKAAMKAMKAKKAVAMKAKAMRRAMKAKKPVSARLAKRHAFFGKITKTASGLKKTDLVKNKAGRIVSKKRSANGKKNSWIVAVSKARKALKIKGFSVVKKGTPFTRWRRSSCE